jgi:DNA-binding GntR family transcriptional regulator
MPYSFDAAIPLNEPTYLKIKRAIVDDLVARVFQPGDHLTIEMLTSRYRVSHMPVREALRQLEGEGIVVSLAHRGFRLEAISEGYIRNIYDIRVGIESMLARRAAENATPDDVNDIERLHAAFVAVVRGENGLAAVRANVEFHRRLYRIARNPEAEQLLEGRIRVVRTVGLSLGGYPGPAADAVIREHEAIVARLAAGDAEGCGRAVFEHVTAARDRVLAHLARPDRARSAAPRKRAASR